jgi:rSAM/selenodomain-associated transferase 1
MRRGGRHLIVLARAPQLGRVKRRLAAAIGDVAAWRFYRDLLLSELGRLADPRWAAWLALTPARSAACGHNWPRGWRRFAQGSGDLGRRMAEALARFRPDAAVLVGADIPELDSAHIARAFAALETHDVVLGPATDGGFWLIGVRRGFSRAACTARALFQGVRWSSATTLADTLACLAPRWRVALIDRLGDVDDGPAFAGWRQAQARLAARPSVRRGMISTKLHGRKR